MTVAVLAPARPASDRIRRAADRLLARWSMYRVVLAALVVLLTAAAITGATGITPYPPLAILASTAVALAATLGGTWLAAAPLRVRPHPESSLITALLVVCLFFPGLDVRDLGAVAIAGAVAGISKTLLAWRGRHVLNPVAVGAVVVTLTQVSGAAWWIATPPLLPVLLVGGAVVLLRAGTWDTALAVVVVALPGAAVRLAAGGLPLPAAAWTAVASYPVLFFAAFMVSEPLTQAPRRWQRLLVGVLIGALTLIPFQVGPVATSPEVALLVGNAVAFGFGPRRRIRLTVADRRLEDGVLRLTFAPERPVRFRAGQYVELTLPGGRGDGRGSRRVFSAASSPLAPELVVVTRLAEPASSFKRRLAGLRPGDRVAGGALGGDFVAPADDGPQVWFAGGIGITPFAAFADDLVRRGRPADVVLVQVARTPGDLLLAPVLAAAGVRALVVGPAAVEPALPAGWTRVADDLAALDLAALIPDLRARWAGAAGSPAFVRAVRRISRAAGGRRIRTDRFLGA
ncbi:oxidoreductase [Amnibacterium sp.]|uniref:FAD-dependent oxidoreductase n=1 Tax=Amnibacterium sp. TaxID=1872496 RepID=UPI002618807B|nr:oxidoreductase [Amnibacterium sp.]MCU1475260.1 hypothetical protein [Amnibacterium sp.]